MNSIVAESTLVGKKEFPAISILVPTHPQYPKNNIDREHMIALLSQAEEQLHRLYHKEKVEQMMEKLHRMVNSINFSALSQGLAIYVSPHIEKMINLPFEVTEKVIVDDSFEIRDLLYAAKLNKQFLVVMISQNKVKTFFGYGNIMMPVHYKDMPDNVKDVTNEHSAPGWDYFDSKTWDEKNLHNYLHFIDDVIERETRNADYPVIVMGDPKQLGYLQHHTHNAKKIIGYVEGNYEHANLADIRKKVDPFLVKYAAEDELKAFDLLYQAVSKENFVAGITEVWRAAAETRGRLLLVEKDFRVSARFGDDNYTIIVDEEVEKTRNRIADAVDDVIELVLKNNGNVVFVENGKLKDYNGIALVTRY
jgi:hypothetical protein